MTEYNSNKSEMILNLCYHDENNDWNTNSSLFFLRFIGLLPGLAWQHKYIHSQNQKIRTAFCEAGILWLFFLTKMMPLAY